MKTISIILASLFILVSNPIGAGEVTNKVTKVTKLRFDWKVYVDNPDKSKSRYAIPVKGRDIPMDKSKWKCSCIDIQVQDGRNSYTEVLYVGCMLDEHLVVVTAWCEIDKKTKKVDTNNANVVIANAKGKIGYKLYTGCEKL